MDNATCHYLQDEWCRKCHYRTEDTTCYYLYEMSGVENAITGQTTQHGIIYMRWV